MNCKNCGTRLGEKAKVCPNCGAFVDDSSGYTLLASDDRIYDVYSSEKKVKKSSPFKTFIAFLLVVLIAGGGALLFFGKIQPSLNKPPEVKFTAGSGVINRNEKVVYVLLDKGSNIQYIHGAVLYDYDRETLGDLRKAVTDDYEYTKNIDTSFRAIFFDTKDYNIVKDENYTYTVEMNFSFTGSDKIYTYSQKINFSGDIKEDASDIIFDHSLSGETGKNKNAPAETEEDKDDFSFINSGYWYTYPSTEGNVRSISAFKFDKGGSFTVTNYVKNGNADWNVSNENGTYKINDGELVLSDGAVFTLDADNEEITEKADGTTTQTLTNRKYNSLANTEDFFGL